MKLRTRRSDRLYRACRAVIGAAAPIVPHSLRREWRAEWESEIWHRLDRHDRWGRNRLQHCAAVLSHSTGAFPHALWLLYQEWRPEMMVQDLRYAFRSLLKRRGFTLVALLTLALGIGANSAIFSVVNAVLFTPLPYSDPDRIAWIWETNLEKGKTIDGVSIPNFQDWQKLEEHFDAMAAFQHWGLALETDGVPEELATIRATPGIFEVLGVKPALGRGLDALAEGGEERGVVLSHGLWQRRFGSDPDVIGQTLWLDEESYRLLGVMPPGFYFPAARVELWTGIPRNGRDWETRSHRSYNVVSRLREGVSMQEASAAVQTVASRLAAEHPESNGGWSARLVSAHEQVVGDVRLALLVLLGAVGFVLLIACGNVANLFLARASARRRELAIRSALGAGRGRLVRQLITESLLLALLGGALGLGLAVLLVDRIVGLNSGNLPRVAEVAIDGPVVLFTALIAAGTGVLFGLLPAVRGSRAEPGELLAHSGGGRSSRSRGRLGGALIVGQVALTIVLLIGAGLLLRSFQSIVSVRPGFQPKNLAAMVVFLSPGQYREGSKRTAFFSELLQRLEALPGVVSAGAVTSLPMNPVGIDYDLPVRVDGVEAAGAETQPEVQFRVATAGYFETVGIPLRRGRTFTAQDRQGAPPVLMINESMARQFWPGDDPIGRQLALPGDKWTSYEVIGVVGDVHHYGLSAEARPELYVPYLQSPYSGMTVAVRSEGDPEGLLLPMQRAVWKVDRRQSITSVQTVDQLVSRSVAQPRLNLILLGGFALLALVLAGIGLFGVIAYDVGQRTQEIGIRMALGARRRNVIGLVVRQGMLLVGVGMAIGILLAYWLSWWMTGLLFGVSPTDPWTFVSVAALLLLVSLAACAVPAGQATRIDPAEALRQD